MISTASYANGLAVGQSIKCTSMQDDRFGYIITRTSETEASLVSVWPDLKTGEPSQDSPDRALHGSFKSMTKDDSTIMTRLESARFENWSTVAEISMNLSGKDTDLRDGEGIAILTSVQYNDKNEIINAELMGDVHVECGKKVKRRPIVQCTKPVVGAAECDITYR